MGAGALTICHNKTAVLVTEDMKKMVQIPILRNRAARNTKVFGASLSELRDRGLVEDGVPVVLRRLVEHLRKHALHQEGLFRVNGNVRAVETLKQRLDGGEHVDLSDSDSCTVASLIKQFLRDLPEGLVNATVQQALIHCYHECGDDITCSDLRDLLQELPDVHHSLLCYLCRFLTQVELNHRQNRMTAFNLATVFGPSVFHVSPGFDAMKDQNICNKIMVKLIQSCRSIFDSSSGGETRPEERSTIIVVKEAGWTDTNKSPSQAIVNTAAPVPRTTMHTQEGEKDPAQTAETLNTPSCTTTLQTGRRKRKVRKGEADATVQVLPQSRRVAGCPRGASLTIPIVLPLTSEARSPGTEAAPVPLTRSYPPDAGSHLSHPNIESTSRPQEEERPISPFYVSPHLSPARSRPDVDRFLNRTISSVVEQHLFNTNPTQGQSSGDSHLTPWPPASGVRTSARQRRRQRREQQEELLRRKERNRIAPQGVGTNKENIPSSKGSCWGCTEEEAGSGSAARLGGDGEPTPKPRKRSPTSVLLTSNQDAHAEKECVCERTGTDHMETFQKGNYTSRKDDCSSLQQTFRMKIQEPPVSCDAGRVGGGGGGGGGGDAERDKPSCEDVPRLDLTALTEENNWGEPVPAYSSPQRDSMDREEPRLSPHAGGFLIRQLLEEDSDPMLSPRFYAYGQCQQYLSDTEVPPSPPNAHSFVSRRRSSSLGSCDDEKEELTTAQLTKRIHVLKRKIHRFEEKFEEEHKYRPSHGDKAANPEVLRWVNELSKLRKDLKEHKLMKSEEDLQPLTRQRSNTLPKSFGSQLEKKPAQEKVPKPPAENTLESILKKLQEKREEAHRPEDIKDMTREQIGQEKVALQKGLLYYESIHGRPVTKNERQIMKPLYDRYRLVKQILCRASTIPVIGSPSSKRRGPLLQPIIEGETALFFDDIKEEEDGSEDDGDAKTQFSVSVRADVSVLSFLEHMEEDADGFISPVDELTTSKNTTDMRLSNLHSATTQELVEQLQEAREEKKRLRKNLKEFEEQFFRQNGRNVQKEDRSPLAAEYGEYKHVKAKLRLLEVLISKRDATKFI